MALRKTLSDILEDISLGASAGPEPSSPEGSFGRGFTRTFTAASALERSRRALADEEEKKKRLADFRVRLLGASPEDRASLALEFLSSENPEKYAELNLRKPEVNYTVPSVGPDGNVTFTPAPRGTKPTTPIKPQESYTVPVVGSSGDVNFTPVPKGQRPTSPVKPTVPTDGKIKPSSSAVDRRAGLQSALQTIQLLRKSYEDLEKEGKTGLRVGTAMGRLGAMTQQDPTATKYNSLRDTLVAFIGRNVGGDVGNFAVKESEYYKNAIPSAFSNKASANALFDSLETIMKNKLGNMESNFAFTGEPTSQGGGGTQSDIPTINSQEEYDALPSGADYIDSNGVRGRKR